MCGRFQASSSPAELARWFETTGPVPNLQQCYNAAPGQHLPIVLRGAETGKRRLVTLRWGLIPAWAKDASYSTINAMAQTVAIKPAFRDAFKSRRCLVPADAFYEWKQLDATTKQPYRFVMADGSPMAFAGLWEQWNDPASGETLRTFTLITGEPNALCAPIHNCIPVILDAADWQTWLGEAPATADELRALLRPYPAERMEAHMIGPRIGNVKNDDAGLIERLNVSHDPCGSIATLENHGLSRYPPIDVVCLKADSSVWLTLAFANPLAQQLEQRFDLAAAALNHRSEFLTFHDRHADAFNDDVGDLKARTGAVHAPVDMDGRCRAWAEDLCQYER